MGITTNSDFRKAIGKQLQKLRKEAGYRSAASFAEKIGVNPNTYTQYEQGLGGLSYERAWDLADALHCSLDELGGREWPPEGSTAEVLADDESQLVDAYRECTPREKGAILNTAQTMAEENK